MGYYGFKPYVSVAKRREKALREMNKLKKKGLNIQPIEIETRKITQTFWGNAWCHHIESFSDYANRLPRGRSYIRNGLVCHLSIQKGCIEAMVSGSSMYKVKIDIKILSPTIWSTIKADCSGKIGTLLELLNGRLSNEVMRAVCDRNKGLFPLSNEIKLSCSCPDWADMCKHVAAVLYGVGARLDGFPEELFKLRGVNHNELISVSSMMMEVSKETPSRRRRLEDRAVANVFGIDIPNKEKEAETIKSKAIEPFVKNNTTDATDKIKKSSSPKVPLKLTGIGLKKIRKQLNLTQVALASHIGVSVSTIGIWEGLGVCKLALKDSVREKLNALCD